MSVLREQRQTDRSGLVLERVSVAFEGVAALAEVDLAVAARETVGLIGPNGAGKTTLINVASGFQRAGSGRVTLDGRDVTGAKPHRLARLGLARTFQGVRLFPGLTVRENVEVACVAAGMRRAEARVQAGRVLADLGLSEHAAAKARTLAYGDERRLALARILALRPRFLLLDEPAAGLDERETAALTQTLRALPLQVGCALVVVEHDMRLIMAVCDRIHVLAQGRTLAVGTPAEIAANEDVVAAYLGRRTHAAAAD